MIARELGDALTAVEYARQQLVLSRALGDGDGIAWAVTNLVPLESLVGYPLVTDDEIDEAGRLFQLGGDASGSAWLLAYCANRSDPPARCKQLEPVRERFRAVGDHFGLAWGYLKLAEARLLMADRSSALLLLSLREGMQLAQGLGAVYLQAFGFDLVDQITSADKPRTRSLDRRLQAGDRLGLALSLVAIADVEARRGRLRRAAYLLGALSHHLLDGPERVTHASLDAARVHDAVQSALGASLFQMLWEKGRAMSLEDAIRYVVSPESTTLEATEAADRRELLAGALSCSDHPLAGNETSSTTARTPPRLMTREEEIVRLVVLGRSNREIAQELSRSVRTVERHLENVYGKTGVTGRAALAFYLFRRASTGVAESSLPG